MSMYGQPSCQQPQAMCFTMEGTIPAHGNALAMTSNFRTLMGTNLLAAGGCHVSGESHGMTYNMDVDGVDAACCAQIKQVSANGGHQEIPCAVGAHVSGEMSMGG